MKKIGYFITFVIEKLSNFRNKFPLLYFISFRIVSMLVILFFLGLAVFGLMSLAPGDIVDNYVRNQLMSITDKNTNNVFTEEQIMEFKKRLGLDLPFYRQYFRWLYNVFVKKDLGTSLITKAPITFLIRDRLINSLILNFISLLVLTVLSFIVAIYLTTKVGTKIDIVTTFVALLLHSFPGLILLILLQMFAVWTGIFPVTAYPAFSFSENRIAFVFSYLHHITLPLIGGFLSGIGGTVRMIRSTMLDQLGQPYITSLRSRGIPEKRIFFNHAFRNTLNPYITGSADLLASLFSGSLILEIIFAYPGIGRLMYEAVLQEDIYLVLTNVMLMSFLILVGMIISDILLALVDPRIKYSNN